MRERERGGEGAARRNESRLQGQAERGRAGPPVRIAHRDLIDASSRRDAFSLSLSLSLFCYESSTRTILRRFAFTEIEIKIERER